MTTRFRGRLSACLILVAVAGMFSAGCQSPEEKDAEKQQRRLERRERRERARNEGSGPEQVIGRRDRERDRDRDRSGSGGDRSVGLDEIPTTASRVDEGSGPRLTYSPTRAGTLYVYDSDDDRVIFSTPLRADERFALDPDAGRATVDGRTVLGTGLSSRARYRLYFDRGGR